MCWTCRSLERHRALFLYLQTKRMIEQPGMRVLHIAAEQALAPLLTQLGDSYVTGDLETTGLDVTDLPFDDASFDGLICNHVLEEVPDDARAIRELRRVLHPDGWGIILVPDLGQLEVTEEDLSLPHGRPRTERFGNPDSLRRYGWDYLDRLSAAGFKPTIVDPGELFTTELIDRARLRKFGELEPIVLVE